MQETWVQSLGWEDTPGEGKGYPLQYSGLEKSMDFIVQGIAESDTTERLSQAQGTVLSVNMQRAGSCSMTQGDSSASVVT